MSARHYHDPELASAGGSGGGGGGSGGGESVRRLDFQARRAAGGVAVHFNPRNRLIAKRTPKP